MPDGSGERYRPKKRWRAATIIAVSVFVTAFAGGMVVTNWPAVAQASKQMSALAAGPTFPICSGPIRRNCVVDGDTFWMDGEKVRVADIDTPEISKPQCDSEYDRGIDARDRLQDLLNEGEFELRPFEGKDRDRYGRLLRVVTRNGQSLGDQLVSEGLARTWTGRREPWC